MCIRDRLEGRQRWKHGPLAKIKSAVRKLGWSWPSPCTVVDDMGGAVDLRTVERQELLHMVREALRRFLWTRAANRRGDMQGIEQGVDREASVALLKSKHVSDYDKGILRSILSGAFWTCHRLARAKKVATSICPFCDLHEVEDETHLWWRCPAWCRIRESHVIAMQAYTDSWPSCLKCCGLMPSNLPQLESTLAYCTVEDTESEDNPNEASQLVEKMSSDCWRGECLLYEDGREVVYTDGACSHNQDSRFRRAGSGIFYCHGDPRNVSTALPGWHQSNQRAELYAVVLALESNEAPLNIRSDSAYVVDGCTTHMWCWKWFSWRGVDNVDLWKRIDTLLASRPPQSTLFTKVKGHAKIEDVQQNIVTPADLYGNHSADRLATAGAALHAVAPEI
eukprot:3628384-Karenia_brevis.AAC.1